MRVRCSYCHADYETAATRAALVLVARCEQCGRDRLYPVNGPEPPGAARDDVGEAQLSEP